MRDSLLRALDRTAVDPLHDDLDTLRTRLVAQASAAGALDLGYRTLDSPLGLLLVAATDLGLARLAYAVEDHDAVLETLASDIGTRILRDDKRFDDLAAQLDGYFTGRRRSFDVPLDLRLSRGFRLDVLRHLREIPWGRTETYSEVAAATGSPRAVRAVGTACATNPVPIIVPCHRVLRADGALGGYLGGVEAKRRLLELEAAA
ncbi:MAG: methylated-DNA--[protein]-cysteine S-methyltransferase [Humibacillus sp.]